MEKDEENARVFTTIPSCFLSVSYFFCLQYNHYFVLLDLCEAQRSWQRSWLSVCLQTKWLWVRIQLQWQRSYETSVIPPVIPPVSSSVSRSFNNFSQISTSGVSDFSVGNVYCAKTDGTQFLKKILLLPNLDKNKNVCNSNFRNSNFLAMILHERL